MKSILKTSLYMALTACALTSAPTLYAQSSTPLKIVIGFSAGGGLDNMSRALAEKLRTELGTTVIVENRPGAGTQLAVQAVKRAAPDGNTILISPATPFIIFPLTYDKLGYDPDRDFIPLAHLADAPMVASTSVNSSYNTMSEYLAWVKQQKDQTGVGMVSLGGTVHFGLLNLNKNTGHSLQPVAYKGAPGMLTDEIGGVLPIGIDTVGGQSELQRSGKIKYLGVTGTQRTPLLPNVPTMSESGAPGFELSTAWYGAFAPAGTPAPVVEKLQAALIKIVKTPDFSASMAQLGLVTTGLPASALSQTIHTQREAFRPVVQKSGFKANQ